FIEYFEKLMTEFNRSQQAAHGGIEFAPNPIRFRQGVMSLAVNFFEPTTPLRAFQNSAIAGGNKISVVSATVGLAIDHHWSVSVADHVRQVLALNVRSVSCTQFAPHASSTWQ